ncbi:hypothetical protein E2C01_062829 [Portunus trituberculatus]|uniref:Uncharacterized protein n=1 Tax=Portunus trituberculatus TaxID=210409 RepID=A0A5B7HF53_PORTR|nr:hypothetical protein [Portunus trituberculatus]
MTDVYLALHLAGVGRGGVGRDGAVEDACMEQRGRLGFVLYGSGFREYLRVCPAAVSELQIRQCSAGLPGAGSGQEGR